MVYYFTSITANYLAKARVLGRTLKKHNPDAVFVLAIADSIPEFVSLDEEPFDHVILTDSLESIGNPKAFFFKHNITEICTALKPFVALEIIKRFKAEKVVYLDPDIAVFSDLSEIDKMLDEHSMLFTPHQLQPEDDDLYVRGNEILFLKRGTYNLGFFAVKADGEGLKFLEWWRDRLKNYCFDDDYELIEILEPAGMLGMFTDQKWIDLVPAFFDRYHIMKDPGFNVSTWNMTRRMIRADEAGDYYVNGNRLRFFHFSGFDSKDHHKEMLRARDYNPENYQALELTDWYEKQITLHGQKQFEHLEWRYSAYSNGVRIENKERKIYHLRKDIQQLFDDPFEIADGMCYYNWVRNSEYSRFFRSDDALESLRKDKDIQINSLAALVENRESQIKDFAVLVKDKDLQITNLAESIQEKDARTNNLAAFVKERDVQIIHIEGLIRQKDDQINNLNTHVSHLTSTLDDVSNSNGWKILQSYYRFIHRLLPPGTNRRRIRDLVSKSVKVLAQEGRTGLFAKTKKYILKRRKAGEAPPLNPTPETLVEMKNESRRFANRPKISIIMPIWNTNEKWLRDAIDSVMDQAYDNWELCLADDHSTERHVKAILKSYKKKDKRIKVVFLKENIGVAGASNAAIDLATGDFIGLMDHDDVLLSSALYEVVKLLNRTPGAEFIYSDEILTDETGKPVYAYFKPDFSLDYFLSHCYIVHFSVIRSEIIRKIGGFRREFNISQDYDLFLRALSETRLVYHIPKVLYLWRQHSLSAGHKMQSQVMDASRKAIQEFLDREGIEGEAHDTKYFNFFRVKRKIIGNPRVSVIIPTKDKADLLRRCIESIEGLTAYKNYEVIVVDNLSQESETLKYLDVLRGRRDTYRVIDFKESFNFSRLNNHAVKFATGDHYLFLNNDVEVISPEWLSAMLEQSQRKEVGCVGAKLLYPDGRVQHVGVIVGWGGRAEHIYKWYDSHDIGYLGHFVSIRDYSAVTAACLMVKKKVFEEVGGYDEKFRVGFGDVDFCLKIRKRGYVNVYTPYAELYHHESATRNPTLEGDSHPKDTELFVTRWREMIEQGDPFYNPNLPLDSYDILPYINFK